MGPQIRISAALLARSYGNLSCLRVWYQVGLAVAVRGTQMTLVALAGHTLGLNATDTMGFKVDFMTFHAHSPAQSRSTV